MVDNLNYTELINNTIKKIEGWNNDLSSFENEAVQQGQYLGFVFSQISDSAKELENIMIDFQSFTAEIQNQDLQNLEEEIKHLVDRLDKISLEEIDKSDVKIIFSSTSIFKEEINEVDSCLAQLEQILSEDEQKLQSIEKIRKQLARLKAHTPHPSTPSFAIQAAEKGKALQAALSLLEKAHTTGEPLEAQGSSTQKVYIDPSGVIKKSEERAESEEKQVDQAFAFFVPDALVPQVAIKEFNLTQFGIEPTDQESTHQLMEKLPTGELTPFETEDAKGGVVKPFVKEMRLLSELRDKGLEENILKKLDQKSFVKLVFTQLFQFCDLHSNNLGFVPSPNDAYRKYEDSTFTYENNENVSINQLIFDYISGGIDETTSIEVKQENGDVKEKMTLMKNHSLRDALNTDWKVVLFDTDVCLMENNELLRNENREFCLPIRLALFSHSIKDVELSEEIITDIIQRIEENESAFQRWMMAYDTPIRRRLSGEGNQTLDEALRPILEEQYYFGPKKFKDYTVEVMREVFGETMQLDQLEDMEMDQEQLLLELKEHPLWGIIVGDNEKNIKLVDTPKKRNRIAKQLFPNFTLFQQNAYLERANNLKQYLQEYREISKLTINRANMEFCENRLTTFLDAPFFPGSSFERQKIQQMFDQYQEINDVKKKMGLLSEIQNQLTTISTPSLFHTACAQYPLLADGYILHERKSRRENTDVGEELGFSCIWNAANEVLVERSEEGVEESPEKAAANMIMNAIQDHMDI